MVLEFVESRCINAILADCTRQGLAPEVIVETTNGCYRLSIFSKPTALASRSLTRSAPTGPLAGSRANGSTSSRAARAPVDAIHTTMLDRMSHQDCKQLFSWLASIDSRLEPRREGRVFY
jgi:hypothetical protein